MSKNNLTDNQAAVLTAIRGGLSIHDGEFVADFDQFAASLAEGDHLKDKKTAKVVLNQLTKKRLLAVNPENGDLTLTDAGKFAITELLFEGNPEGLAEQEAHLEELAEKFDTPEKRKAHLQSFGKEEAPEEDLIGEADPVKTEVETESYTATEWTEPGDEADIEWTETIFKDGSKTLKRRKKVSGAWRTDYWGTDAGADKQVFTTAKACKMARAYGSFNSAI